MRHPKRLAKKLPDIKKKMKEAQKYLILINCIIIVLGFLIYLGRKKMEYKDSFNFGTFLVGKPNCSGNRDAGAALSPVEALQKAFT
jgi:hypothetical protein